MRSGTRFVFMLSAVAAVVGACQATARRVRVEDSITIVSGEQVSAAEDLAAKEVRRYIYLRTGALLPIVKGDWKKLPKSDLIVVASKRQPVVKVVTQKSPKISACAGALESEQYMLKTLRHKKRQVVLVTGGDDTGTLYGAYRFAEHLGVRFYLHGDTIPDGRIPLKLPDLDEQGKPLFRVRGIQPFHDFPEGPDWWNADDYKAIIAQLPKLRMNFIGLHTYPQGGAGPEPTVWIGLAQDVGGDGKVKFSSPSSYQNTLRGNWGYAAKKTGDFCFGADLLFERDDYGPEVMYGLMPWPKGPEENNELFNRVGDMLKEAFEYAHALGVKTCVGTETPLVVPDVVKERLRQLGKDPAEAAVVQEIYEGMFTRIARAYPLDYYWFWTPEDWTWGNPKDEQVEGTLSDLRAAIAAHEKAKPAFTPATCGWVLGPPKDRALFDKVLPREMPISCINRNVGFTPVESGFGKAEGRAKWAIPWMEDDPALIIPQLWAGRMRRDAADALAYGCDGLLGIHWRTRILGPNVSALAQAAWDQPGYGGWNPDVGKKTERFDPKLAEGREGGNVAQFPNSAIAETEDDPLYQTVIWDVKAYRVKVPDGGYSVTLKFCEPHYGEAGKRVFGVKVQDKTVIDKLDIFATVGKNKALDYTFKDTKVTGGLLEIEFVNIVEFPSIAGLVVQGKDITRKINCGGPAYKDYEADLSDPESSRPRDLPVEDFYADWALMEFGPQVAERMGKMFARLDGGPLVPISQAQKTNLPRPSTWVNGPGGIAPDDRPWEQVSKEYALVDEMEKVRSSVRGEGDIERFDYWLNNFKYLRAVGQVNCTWARFNAAMKIVKEQKDAGERTRLAKELAVPIRMELVKQVGEVHRYLLATVSTTGEMGTVANWQQHLLPTLLTEPGKELAATLGSADGVLPPDAIPQKQYEGAARIIVPTVRGSIKAGESLRLKVILLATEQPRKASVFFRPMGRGTFAEAPLEHVGRRVYGTTIAWDAMQGQDFEYYVKASFSDDTQLVFPATAPKINQTVVLIERD